MSNPDPAKVIFSSRFRYFLNKAKETASLTVPTESIGAFEYTTKSFSIPIETNEDFSQIKLNFSQDPTEWYIFPMRDIDLDSTFKIAVSGSYAGSNFVVNLTIYDNAGGGTTTAFTVTAKAYLFEPPTQ